MKVNPLVSIIITVYNMEQYLEECMESVLNQTYYDLDVVLVDDGSRDRSGRICDEYAIKDKRVQVLHKENGGLVSAWMAGVGRAKGDYLLFVDSDDWIELTMVEELCEHLKGNLKEVICSDYIIENKTKSVFVRQALQAGSYDREYIENKLTKNLLGNEERMIHCSRCMKLISKELIVNNMKYCNPEITMGEDLNIMFPALLDAERIVVVQDGFYYHYRFVDVSMAHKYSTVLYEKVNILYKELQNTIKDKFQDNVWKEIVLETLKKEYVFLLFLVLKNELRGPWTGCIARIVKIIKESKKQEELELISIGVRSKANKLLYFIWKYPGTLSVAIGRSAMWIFDHL